MYIKWGGI